MGQQGFVWNFKALACRSKTHIGDGEEGGMVTCAGNNERVMARNKNNSAQARNYKTIPTRSQSNIDFDLAF